MDHRSRFVVARILNHAESGVTTVYDRHSYDTEKREALDRWALEFERIVSHKSDDANEHEGADVVPFPGSK